MRTAYTIRRFAEPNAAETTSPTSPAATTRKINPNALHTRMRKRA